jgi:hypothetical protein
LLTCHNFLPSSCKNKINQPNFIGLHISCNNNRFIEEFPVINFILSCKTILLNNILYKKFILYFSDIGPNIDTGPVNAMVMVGRACVVCIALCYVQTLNKTLNWIEFVKWKFFLILPNFKIYFFRIFTNFKWIRRVKFQ